MEVWGLVSVWTGNLVPVPPQGASIEEWWCEALAQQPNREIRKVAALLMYTAWNLCKERNRRIFERNEAEPSTMLHFVKEEVNLRFRACGAP